MLIAHSQANRDTRPNLIGGYRDYVRETGEFVQPPERDLETRLIGGRGALYKVRQLGIYAYLTHNLIEAVELDATAHFKVEGKEQESDDRGETAGAATRVDGRRANKADRPSHPR